MAQRSYRRESGSDRPERISVERAVSRGGSQERRPSQSYVRPTAEDATDDEEPLPVNRPHRREIRRSHEGPLPSPLPPLYYPEASRYYPEASRGPPIAYASRYTPYLEEDYPREQGHRPPSPPRPGPVDYEPGPNFPRPTPIPPERASFYRPRPRPSSPARSEEGIDVRRRRNRRHHHRIETSEFMDDDGGHYDKPTILPHRVCREAEPTPANQQITTSNYYDGSGNKAWTRKNQERSGFGPPPELFVNPLEPAPQQLRYVLEQNQLLVNIQSALLLLGLHTSVSCALLPSGASPCSHLVLQRTAQKAAMRVLLLS